MKNLEDDESVGIDRPVEALKEEMHSAQIERKEKQRDEAVNYYSTRGALIAQLTAES
ncbi:hypothetical protein F511_46236 [Dorcoceras hygrometricum]|uniref:Uncharacterized protein n=1 Tax=Dorcoceras hygrometricum TaxID=472368 RepID=A0A2Z6ZUH9_9LAMI|nr:hypothetical protein F511_46236 [Dorcoceras hygrometricum]